MKIYFPKKTNKLYLIFILFNKVYPNRNIRLFFRLVTSPRMSWVKLKAAVMDAMCRRQLGGGEFSYVSK